MKVNEKVESDNSDQERSTKKDNILNKFNVKHKYMLSNCNKVNANKTFHHQI